ncbi:MAG: hypothetical protein SGILL_006938 [Bacillariaceae sp.]
MERICKTSAPQPPVVMNEKEQLIQSLLDAAVDQAEQKRNMKQASAAVTTTQLRVIEFVAPNKLPEVTEPYSIVPGLLFEEDVGGNGQKDACAICFEALSSRPSVALTVCAHIFHLDCIDEFLDESNHNTCPQCHKAVKQDPHGTSPSGTMSISTHMKHELPPGTASFRGDTKVIKLHYEMPDGFQKVYHNRPGERYRGCVRNAYLPDTLEGRTILERLVYAFSHGLTFQISPNKRKPDEKDVVNYATIPHRAAALDEKDDQQILYYIACHDELDQLGVPRPNHTS